MKKIFQAAARLGEEVVHKRHELRRNDLEAAAAVSQEMLGEKLTKILIAQSQKPEPEVNLLLVQVVLQILMVKFCFSKIQSCNPGDSAVGDFLSSIYSEIHSTKEQAWRALTRAHTRPSTETWGEELYKKRQSVMIIASWAPLSPETEKSYENRLPSIFKAINEVRLAIGEIFTSADLDVMVFECDQIYNPAVMDDACSDGRQSSSKRVLEVIVGTTGIGLGKVTKRNAKDVLQTETLISPKVVLTSTLNDALESIQPTTVMKKKEPVENTNGANQDARD